MHTHKSYKTNKTNKSVGCLSDSDYCWAKAKEALLFIRPGQFDAYNFSTTLKRSSFLIPNLLQQIMDFIFNLLQPSSKMLGYFAETSTKSDRIPFACIPYNMCTTILIIHHSPIISSYDNRRNLIECEYTWGTHLCQM